MAEHPIGPGTLLAGRFRLEDLLDENDGARFWRATDRILARNVAVHVIPQDDRRSEALLVAARTSATVSDGHLLRVLDASEEDGVTYVVNEWGHGMSLDRILADGPLSPRRAAWVVKEVAEAIATAHRAGIAHGRLLPENVMVTEAGSVKLIGFVVDAVLRGRDSLRTAAGSPLSEHESDVLNLGALLYVSLTGKWPGTQGSTLPAAPGDHGVPLRPRQVRAGVPRPLDAVCDRVLNPSSHGPAIESAHEVYAALADYVDDGNGGALGFAPAAAREDQSATGSQDRVDPDSTAAHPGPLTGGHGDQDDAGHDRATRVAGQERGAAADSAAAAAAAAVATGSTAAIDARRAGDDPDPTQAGVPVFFDEDTGVGWTGESTGRGLRTDEADPLARRTPPPPPPPLPEPEPRPLFAPDPPEGSPRRGAAAPAATSARHTDQPQQGAATPDQHRPRRSTGPGAGPLPSSWGPDAATGASGESEPAWGTPGWERQHPGTSWLRLAGVVGGLIVLVVALVFAFNLGKGSDNPTTSPSGGSSTTTRPAVTHEPVQVSAAHDFDPEGNPPSENPEQAPLAIDGNPATVWQTSTYRGRPDLGGLKSGVGLLLDLGKPTDVSQVKVTLQGSPTSLDLLAAPASASQPTSTAGLTKLASVQGAGTAATLSASSPYKTRYLVVWLTSLPAQSGGFQGRVAEITVRS